jgi:phosphoribosylformylglycinamidine cyclo-ligase
MTADPRSRGARSVTYAEAGVDVAAADETVKRYRDLARATARPEVLGGVGPFAALWQLDLSGYRQPVIVSSADGVGTKLQLAAVLERYDSVGRDLVNHCVNDILTTGAEPLFFLDYLGTNGLSQDRRVEVVGGMAAACAENGLSLVGGETADMPDVYRHGDYDVAGFIVGIVERDRVIDGSRITEGDTLLALPSTGLQTNGYSLVREIWGVGKGVDAERDRAVLNEVHEELGGTLGDALLAVHGSFLPALRPVLDRLHGIAHITGGGIPGNLGRIFPEALSAHVDPATWTPPPLFALIQREGGVSDAEMFRTFNMGVGMVVAVAPEDATGVLAALPGACRIGKVRPREGDEHQVQGVPR